MGARVAIAPTARRRYRSATGAALGKMNLHNVYADGQQVAALDEAGKLDVQSRMTGFSNTDAGKTQSVVQAGETARTLAQRIYGNGNLWYVIVDANALSVDADTALVAGESLTVPEVRTSSNDANTFKPYNPGEITGPTSPGLPYIPPPDKGCGTLGMIIMVAVAVIVTVYTAGALSGMVGAGMGTLTTGSAIAVGAIAGAAGSAASLAAGSMMGVASFNWTGVAAGAVTGAITGGLAAQFGSVGDAINGSIKAGVETAPNLMKAVGLSLANGAAGHAGQALAGTGASFSWKSIAASAVSSLVTGKYAEKVSDKLGLQSELARDFSYGMTGGMVSAAARSSFGQTLHRSDYAAVLGDAIGGAVGGAMSRQTNEATARTADQASAPGRTPSGDWDPMYLLASNGGGGVPAIPLPEDIRAAAEGLPRPVTLDTVTVRPDEALRAELAYERRQAASEWLRAGDRLRSDAIDVGRSPAPVAAPVPPQHVYSAARAPAPSNGLAIQPEVISPTVELGKTLLDGYMSIQDEQLLAAKAAMGWVRERSRDMVENAQSPWSAGLGAALYAINSVTEAVVSGTVDSARLVTNGHERDQFLHGMGVLLTTNPATTASAAWGHWSQMSDEERYIAAGAALVSLPKGVTNASVLADILPVGSPSKLTGTRLPGPALTEDIPNAIRAESSAAAFDGALYPTEKLRQLVSYLEKRGVSVYGTEGNPSFIARADGTGMMQLPANPTVLQVKHELSHYLDFKKMGFEAYRDMGRTAREASVLDRLKNNRLWPNLNQAEKDFSINYVERLRSEERIRNGY